MMTRVEGLLRFELPFTSVDPGEPPLCLGATRCEPNQAASRLIDVVCRFENLSSALATGSDAGATDAGAGALTRLVRRAYESRARPYSRVSIRGKSMQLE